MDKERLPHWGWLLVGLFGAVVVGNSIYYLALAPMGVPREYDVVPVIALMAPVLFMVNVWYDDDRAAYWEHSRAHVAGDVAFTVFGAAVGAAIAIVGLLEVAFVGEFLRSILGMVVGFVFAWGLFWWRNLDLYRSEN